MSAIGFCRVVHRLSHWASSQRPIGKGLHSLPRDVHVCLLNIAAVSDTTVKQCGNHRRANAHVRIEHAIALISQREHEPFDQLYGELTGVDCLFNMVTLNIWKNSHIAGVFPLWIAGQLAGVWTFEMSLIGVFRRDADRIQLNV